ncbi:DUF842-containing protein [Aureococcus anophagefferens]|nr:DUF842-containing protein [Aureococcus anophagefferens]
MHQERSGVFFGSEKKDDDYTITKGDDDDVWPEISNGENGKPYDDEIKERGARMDVDDDTFDDDDKGWARSPCTAGCELELFVGATAVFTGIGVKQQALQRSVDDLVTGIDKSHLMPMRKSAFLAMAKCCDLGTAAAYQQCVQRAGAPEQRASAVMQQELGEFQQRLQRAAMACQDEVKDYGYKDQAKMQGAFESCVNGALDKHMKLLPTIKKRIEASF